MAPFLRINRRSLLGGLASSIAAQRVSAETMNLITGFGPAIIPTTILGSSLKLWLKPGDLYSDAGVTKATVAATKVQQWNDSSGNKNHATQTTVANQMQVSDDILNGLQVLKSTGSPTNMNNAYTGDVGLSIVVFAMPTGTVNNCLMGAKSLGQTNAAYFIKSSTNLTQSPMAVGSFNGTTINNVICRQQVADQLWSIIAIRRTGGSSGYVGLWLGGVHIGSNYVGNVNAVDPAGPAFIGSNYNAGGPADYLVSGGDIAEVIVADTDCSDVQFAGLTDYLKTKYNLYTKRKFVRSCMLTDDNSLYILESDDGIHWDNTPVDYQPPNLSKVRDPSIIYDEYGLLGTAGRYWIVHTNSSNLQAHTQDFDLAYSDDLSNWVFVQHVDCTSIGGGTNQATWAPEWYIDTPNSSAVHVFFAGGTTTTTQFIYEIHPVNQSNPFGAWSTPVIVPVTGQGGAGQGIIDPQVHYLPNSSALGPYYLFFKKLSPGNTLYGTSATLLGTYTPQVSGNWGGLSANEGTNLVNISGSVWNWWGDLIGSASQFITHPNGFNSSTGLFATTGWTSPVNLIGPPAAASGFSLGHGTVIFRRGT